MTLSVAMTVRKKVQEINRGEKCQHLESPSEINSTRSTASLPDLQASDADSTQVFLYITKGKGIKQRHIINKSLNIDNSGPYFILVHLPHLHPVWGASFHDTLDRITGKGSRWKSEVNKATHFYPVPPLHNLSLLYFPWLYIQNSKLNSPI